MCQESGKIVKKLLKSYRREIRKSWPRVISIGNDKKCKHNRSFGFIYIYIYMYIYMYVYVYIYIYIYNLKLFIIN